MENFNRLQNEGETSHPQQQQPSNLRQLLHARGEGLTQFNELISRNDERELLRFASMLTSDSDHFFKIANDREGSICVRRLLGRSLEMDQVFVNAIGNRFIDIMTGQYSYLVAVNVFNATESNLLALLTLRNTFYLASDKIGCLALNQIITGSNGFLRSKFLEEIAENADWLSMDDSGTFVVQHALKFCDMGCTNRIAFRLYGCYVELSSEKSGSYVVEQILDSGSMMALDLVVEELLECGGDVLLRLARNQFGNYVVKKALEVTWRERKFDLFWGLVKKLFPLLGFLRRSHGRNIAAFIDSVIIGF